MGWGLPDLLQQASQTAGGQFPGLLQKASGGQSDPPPEKGGTPAVVYGQGGGTGQSAPQGMGLGSGISNFVRNPIFLIAIAGVVGFFLIKKLM